MNEYSYIHDQGAQKRISHYKKFQFKKITIDYVLYHVMSSTQNHQ
jgi:hypothetical protein